ncbi:MAG: glycosyltransferase family 2 protein [bacterium]|nr:glycosyltransferase family 2 protein [bacterium]
MSDTSTPRLSAVVVHWRDEEHLGELLAAWPREEAFELLVVDNSDTLGERTVGESQSPARRISPGRNLGFAGGVNRGVADARAPIVLILNADARPRAGALQAIVTAFDEFPDATGIVPALVDADGGSQHRWQLQPLPTPWTLLLQTFFLAGRRGPREEPARGTPVEQPAAAALALRTEPLRRLGGLDERFYPAWFEDVDLAHRLAAGGHRLIYEPGARFVHAGGAAVPTLGYGPFLWIYYRGLERYLRLHHAAVWSFLARLTLPAGMLARLALLPLRRPRRASSRRHAAAGLLAVVAGAASGWRRPAGYARRFSPGEPE